MFAYKLLLSTFYTLHIGTSVVSWFHLYFLLRQTKMVYPAISSCVLLYFKLIWNQTQGTPEEMDIGWI